MTRAEFVRRYCGIYEHSPWVAEQAYGDVQAGDSTARLAEVMAARVEAADRETRLALLRAHPDLAGRAAIGGELTEASGEEQASAGIDRCTPDEFERFTSLNERYRERFGFPFIMAVRNSNRRAILEAFETRLDNDADTEFHVALQQVHKIARLRLQAMDEQ